MIFDIENWLWKSDLGTFTGSVWKSVKCQIKIHLSKTDFWATNLLPIDPCSQNSSDTKKEQGSLEKIHSFNYVFISQMCLNTGLNWQMILQKLFGHMQQTHKKSLKKLLKASDFLLCTFFSLECSKHFSLRVPKTKFDHITAENKVVWTP